MRRKYPYLQDAYFANTGLELEHRSVLKDIEDFANQRQYVRITLLD